MLLRVPDALHRVIALASSFGSFLIVGVYA
jgi:hypothetical protein